MPCRKEVRAITLGKFMSGMKGYREWKKKQKKLGKREVRS